MTLQTNRLHYRRKDLWTRALAGTCLLLLLGLGGLVVPAAGNAEPVTWKDLGQRLEGAQTAADHEAIADFYKAQAALAGEQVKNHECMMKSYGAAPYKSPHRPADWMRNHCENLIKTYRDQQAEYESLADVHTEMAKKLAGQK
jgi:hypothetical protein